MLGTVRPGRFVDEWRAKVKPDISASQQLLSEIEALEQEANRIGAYVTARTLNQAKNALGWEMAGDVLMAGKISRGERPRRRAQRS
jgi:hypothetical protein